jgi:putative transposase
MEIVKIAEQWRIPDAVWERVKHLFPTKSENKKGGRPPVAARTVLDGIFYILRTGCQWKATPREFSSGSTLHLYFQRWVKSGIFKKLWHTGLLEYDLLKGIKWSWQVIDGSNHKSPLNGLKTGPNPTDRGKLGTKHSLLTDGDGIPLGIVVGGANIHDIALLRPTLEKIVVSRPKTKHRRRQHLCGDKAYYSAPLRKYITSRHYIPNIAVRGVDYCAKQKNPKYKARRWVVERTHSWLNRFRKLFIRWEKKPENYEGLLHFASAWVAFRAAGVLG